MSSSSIRFAEYLKARRAQLKPQDAGYPADPGRRVSGLKREEVAELAGISLEYYVRLEQGRDYRPSELVLAGLTRALQMDEDAAAYFYRLALPEPPRSEQQEAGVLDERLLHLLEEWSHVPVFLIDRNLDVLAVNELSLEIFPLLVPGANLVLSVFSVPPEVRNLEGWPALARASVAGLRFGGDPTSPRLQEVVGELSIREPLFREMWADHEARPFRSGSIDVFLAGFGQIEFEWQVLGIPGGTSMTVWVPAPGSAAAVAIDHVRAGIDSRAARLGEARAS